MRMSLEHLCPIPNMGNRGSGREMSCLKVCGQAVGQAAKLPRCGRVPPPREKVMQYPRVGEGAKLPMDARGERFLHR